MRQNYNIKHIPVLTVFVDDLKISFLATCTSSVVTGCVLNLEPVSRFTGFAEHFCISILLVNNLTLSEIGK